MILDNYIFLIHGERGSWKTMFATLFAYLENYKTIFANYTIKFKKDVNFVKYENRDIFTKLKPFKKKALIIMDEWGINLNSRRSMDNFNVFLGKLLFVSRKYNCDFIFITQYLFTVDKYVRQSSNFILSIKKRKRLDKFEIIVDVYKNNKFVGNMEYIKTFKIRPWNIINKKVRYNTLETSILDDNF